MISKLNDQYCLLVWVVHLRSFHSWECGDFPVNRLILIFNSLWKILAYSHMMTFVSKPGTSLRHSMLSQHSFPFVPEQGFSGPLLPTLLFAMSVIIRKLRCQYDHTIWIIFRNSSSDPAVSYRLVVEHLQPPIAFQKFVWAIQNTRTYYI